MMQQKAIAQNQDIIWRLEGPFDSTYSLALLNREIARALSAQGVDVALFSTEGPGDFVPSRDFLEKNPDLGAMNQRADVVGHSEASVTSRNLYPPRVADMACERNLMHSYAWEESGFPPDWVRAFNRHLTGVTCLSSHVLRILRDNGVSVPMAVSGCGVDHWERIEASSESVLDDLAPRSFRFLHVSSFFPRKGPDALLEAYGRAFTVADDVSLIIKTFPNPHNRIREQLEAMRAKFPGYPHVIVIEEDLPDADLKALYLRCHVLVAPSCAEGFGLPLAEAMLTGMPVIVTGWSGQMDFCTKQNAWLVDYTYEQADTHFNLKPSAWAAIDVDALAATMQGALHSKESVRRAMARRGRDLLLKKFTWARVAERLVDFYRAPAGDRFGLPSIGWVSTWNAKCGIATYSEHLVVGMRNKPIMLAARTDALLQPDGDNCLRCWSVSDDDDLAELSRIVDQKGLDVIVIQFNFGFFHHTHLRRFLERQKAAGRVIVLDMHATQDPPQAPHKNLLNYVPALALADRLLTHSIADMNRLKSCGLNENLMLFPHGILDLPSSPSSQSVVPTIATYGFCLPHKGLEQVVDAIALLRDVGERVDLRMINAEYPVDFSADLARELRARVARLGLDEQVMIETRFLPDEESISLLLGADLVLFVYHPTSESASGAVRYGLACGKPTLVTDLPIFAEFGDSVWRVNDSSPGLLAHTLREVLGHIRSGSPEHQYKQQLGDAWRAQHRYSWLSERLEGMLQGLHSDVSFS